MLKNNIETIKQNLNNIKDNYKEFENYFYDVFNEWIDYYKLDHFKNHCCDIVDDLLLMLDTEIFKVKYEKKVRNNKDVINYIYCSEIIGDVLWKYFDEIKLNTEEECIRYLIENDDTLKKSIKLAKEARYSIEKITTVILANLLYFHNKYNNYKVVFEDFREMVEIFFIHYINYLYPRKIF